MVKGILFFCSVVVLLISYPINSYAKKRCNLTPGDVVTHKLDKNVIGIVLRQVTTGQPCYVDVNVRMNGLVKDGNIFSQDEKPTLFVVHRFLESELLPKLSQ